MVFVLIADMDGVERPVGVVSTEEQARAFISADTGRDYIPFNMDEIVGLDAQTPGEIETPSLGDSHKDLDDMTRQLTDLHSQMKDLRPKRKAFKSSLLRAA